MIRIDHDLTPVQFREKLDRFWALSAWKIKLIDQLYNPAQGSPVFTVRGEYTSRGWTEWTQGFQYGSGLLQFDATGDSYFLEKNQMRIVEHMAPHVSHVGVHDHGFNNVSTYGTLLRLMREEKVPFDWHEQNFYELALKISGAVQASRWTTIENGVGTPAAGTPAGFIHSFNGPHSLFVDTVRSCRALVLSHALGHVFQGEGDLRINLLERAIQHLRATAQYSVFYGEGRDAYDVRGRTAHECVFNITNGAYRCPNSQQGYSGFTTWTRGLAWAMLGFAEQLEFFATLDDGELDPFGGRGAIETMLLNAARATCDFYLDHTPTDGVPYWDTGAPNLHHLGDYLDRPADPFNDYEPVDSSAAAIGVQGLLRLGTYLTERGETEAGTRYRQAGLTVLNTLLDEPYLSTDPNHQGLLLHSIYHRPNGWDYVPAGRAIPCGESSMWGDYHLREVALLVQRMSSEGATYAFFDCLPR